MMKLTLDIRLSFLCSLSAAETAEVSLSDTAKAPMTTMMTTTRTTRTIVKWWWEDLEDPESRLGLSNNSSVNNLHQPNASYF